MTKSFMLIDGNSLGYAAANASPLSANGQPVHAIFHTLKMIRSAINTWSDEYRTPLILWDGKEYWRKDLYPEYKQRDDNNEKAKAVSEDYKRQRPELIKALKMLGLTQMIGRNYEADDLAGYISRFFSAKGYKVLLVSGDKDWIQLVNRNVTWFDPIRDRKCTRNTIEDLTGFASPADFLQGKALIGDTSDNIPGIDGIGPKAAPLIMQEFGGVEGLFEAFNTHGELDKKAGTLPESMSRYRKKINAFCSSQELRDRYDLNIKLMNLLDVQLSMSDLTTVQSEPNMLAFREFCEYHAFASILRNMRDWERLFKNTLETKS